MELTFVQGPILSCQVKSDTFFIEEARRTGQMEAVAFSESDNWMDFKSLGIPSSKPGLEAKIVAST